MMVINWQYGIVIKLKTPITSHCHKPQPSSPLAVSGFQGCWEGCARAYTGQQRFCFKPLQAPRFMISGYPLVNIYKKRWKITMLLMGKLTISMAMFNSYVTNYQRVPNLSMSNIPSSPAISVTKLVANGRNHFGQVLQELL